MEAKESKILDILTENKKYIVPSYQRPYSWNHEQAEQLIKDIHDSFSEKLDQEYFIGSLICIDKGNDEYEIVDGQQRLTTLSLILAKIRDLIVNEKVKSNIQKRILPIDDFSDKPQEPRLKIRKKEEDLYKNYILQGNKGYLPKEANRTYTEKLFIDNFETISDYLKDFTEEILIKLVEYILKNVYVVLVKTENFASSYRLFNVLNTRGLSLKQSDLLKNRLFEIAENSVKNDYSLKETDYEQIASDIERHWEEMEDKIGIDKMDDFLILHETSKKKNRNKAVVVSKIAEHFSEKVNSDYGGHVINFVLELKKSAENYRRILEVSFDDPKLCRIFQCLLIFYSEWIPPMLAFLNKSEQDNALISPKNFSDFVTTFEKCYIHRWFSRMTKSQREVICYDTVANINNNLSFEGIQKKLKSFAMNDSLESYLTGDIYESRSNRMNLLRYVLLRLDQEMQDTSVSKVYNEKITIEHILPQNMENEYWQQRFTNEQHKKWINKLGNLTLLSGYKNSKAINAGFDKKLEAYKNKTVSFDISKNVLEYSEWNVENLEKRHQFLSKLAKEIWYINP